MICVVLCSGEAYSTEAYKALCEFSSVESFWRYYSFIPTPSDVFTEVPPTSIQQSFHITYFRLPGFYPPSLPSLGGPNTHRYGHSGPNSSPDPWDVM